MKNVQVIESAQNATNEVYQLTDEEFSLMFPSGTDIVFPEDVRDRLPIEQRDNLFKALWSRPIDKKVVQGIHGSYCLDFSRSVYFPTRKEADVIDRGPAVLEAQEKWEAMLAELNARIDELDKVSQTLRKIADRELPAELFHSEFEGMAFQDARLEEIRQEALRISLPLTDDGIAAFNNLADRAETIDDF